jgi:hypothetical protein
MGVIGGFWTAYGVIKVGTDCSLTFLSVWRSLDR